MGLAAPRKKIKISHDPNNTAWSRSTSGFGHKILTAQGWTPGSFLGARNAAHADTFTAASASHIRVLVKDDTLGLGARAKRDPLDEPTGLDAFKGLLGRLNGKSDVELQADQKKRDDAKLARYAATKWQAVRFISGGLLTQEKNDELSARDPLKDKEHSPRTPGKEAKDESAASTDDTGDDSEEESRNELGDQREDRDRKDKRDRNDKKEKKEEKGKKEKKEKKERKEKKEKKDKKDKKRKRAEHRDVSATSTSQEQSSENDSGTSKDKDQSSSDAGSSLQGRRPIGRHMLRGRYIAQKKKAVMDERSLNEIFMVKS